MAHPHAYGDPGGPERRELSRLVLAAAGFFAGQMEGNWVPGYLAGRGFGEETWRPWGIGYAPQAWTALTDCLRGLGYSGGAIQAAGVAKRSKRGTLIDAFRDRAMFGIWSPDGTMAGFIGRARPGADQHVPVYLNSRTTRLYRKGGMLFGLHEGREAIAAGARPVIVEGPLDAIAVTVAGAGRFAGVAPCGTALTPAQVGVLGRACDLSRAGVVVAFDADRAGRRAAVRAYGLLRGVTDQLVTVAFPAGQDPAGFRRDYGAAALTRQLESGVPLADLVVDETLARFERWLDFTDGKFGALRAVAPLIAALPPGQVGRQVARVAARLGLTHGEVTEAVISALTASE
jgi:DNA primase